jgi:hypothetical protein
MVTLENDGVLELCPNVSSRWTWPAIRSVDDLGDLVVIRVEGNRGIILPKRDQLSEVEAFGAAVSQAHQVYKNRALASLGPA